MKDSKMNYPQPGKCARVRVRGTAFTPPNSHSTQKEEKNYLLVRRSMVEAMSA